MRRIHRKEDEPMFRYRFQFIVCSLTLFFAKGIIAEEDPIEGYLGKVLGVTSGDTMVVMHDGKAEKIRVAGIVAPDLNQNAGEEAREFLTGLVRLKQATIMHCGTPEKGIQRAEVRLTDGRVVAEELLKSGWAWWDRVDAKENKSLEGLENAARKAKKGLWVEESPIPPWEYREATRKNPVSRPVRGGIPSSALMEIPAAAGILGSTGMRRPPVDANYSVPRTSTPNRPRQTDYWSIDNRRSNSYQRGVQRHATEHLYYNQRRR